MTIDILESANVLFLEELIVGFRETGLATKYVKYIGRLIGLECAEKTLGKYYFF